MTVSKAAAASRPYRSTLREEQARRTRAAVLHAAGACFADVGWATTTMKDIARRAGVSVETVYAQGTKAALMLAAVDSVLAGDDGDIPLLERPGMQAVLGSADSRSRIRALGRAVGGGLGPILPVLVAFRAAAAADSGLAAAYEVYEQRRLTDMTRLVTGLELRPGLTTERAADVLYTLMGIDVISLLVDGRGWTTQEYGDWLADSLERLLIA